jgi:carbon storage regulator
MFVFSRKKDEALVINGDITVTIIEIRGDKVRLGLEIPPNMTLHRAEVYKVLMAQSNGMSAPRSTPPPSST